MAKKKKSPAHPAVRAAGNTELRTCVELAPVLDLMRIRSVGPLDDLQEEIARQRADQYPPMDPELVRMLATAS